MNFKIIIEKLMSGYKLSTLEAYELMSKIGENSFNEGRSEERRGERV